MQTAVGVAMFYFPAQVWGSVEKGKAVWKYHRASGYFVWSLVLVSCVLGTQSNWSLRVWNNRLVWVIFGALVFIGMISRVQLSKMKIF